MIIKFNIYEKLNYNAPELGDFVICRGFKGTIYDEFLQNTIGKVIFKDERENEEKPYLIAFFDEIPDELKTYFYKRTGPLLPDGLDRKKLSTGHQIEKS